MFEEYLFYTILGSTTLGGIRTLCLNNSQEGVTLYSVGQPLYSAGVTLYSVG